MKSHQKEELAQSLEDAFCPSVSYAKNLSVILKAKHPLPYPFQGVRDSGEIHLHLLRRPIMHFFCSSISLTTFSPLRYLLLPFSCSLIHTFVSPPFLFLLHKQPWTASDHIASFMYILNSLDLFSTLFPPPIASVNFSVSLSPGQFIFLWVLPHTCIHACQ